MSDNLIGPHETPRSVENEFVVLSSSSSSSSSSLLMGGNVVLEGSECLSTTRTTTRTSKAVAHRSNFRKSGTLNFEFRCPTGRLRVIWGNRDVEHERLLSVTGEPVRVLDMFGVELPGVSSMSAVELQGKVLLPVGRCPLYVFDGG